MKKSTINMLCAVGIVVPLILPYMMWHPAVKTILCALPAGSVQLLLCRNSKIPWVKMLPVLAAGLWAGWGTLLFFMSAAWEDALFTDLLMEYFSPLLGCGLVWGILSIRR